jgi:hypothetical protein
MASGTPRTFEVIVASRSSTESFERNWLYCLGISAGEKGAAIWYTWDFGLKRGICNPHEFFSLIR